MAFIRWSRLNWLESNWNWLKGHWNDGWITLNCRKVYAILMVQLTVTAGFIALFLFEPNTAGFSRKHPELMLISVVCTLILTIVLLCYDDLRRTWPMNFILLMAFTICEGWMMGTFCSFFEVDTFSFTPLLTGWLISTDWSCSVDRWSAHGRWNLRCGLLRADHFRFPNQMGFYSLRWCHVRLSHCSDSVRLLGHDLPGRNRPFDVLGPGRVDVLFLLGLRHSADAGRQPQVFHLSWRVHLCCPVHLLGHHPNVYAYPSHDWQLTSSLINRHIIPSYSKLSVYKVLATVLISCGVVWRRLLISSQRFGSSSRWINRSGFVMFDDTSWFLTALCAENWLLCA